MRELVRAVVLAVALSLAAAPAARAQAPDLDTVEALASAGRADQAREALTGWWAAEHDAAPRREQQRALWLRARLTVDPEQAMLDYRRLAILYPGGPYTDQALFRLAQAAHALGDAEAAREHVQALERDYPGAAATRAARTWLADAGDAPPPAAGRTVAEGAAAGAGAGQTPAASEPRYSVQLGAFGERERAESVHAEAVERGFDARIVGLQGSPLIHVRVGSFAERPPAQELLERLEAAGLEAAIVRDARPERPDPR